MKTVRKGQFGPGEELTLRSGILTELHVEMGRQNLLLKIDAHYRGKHIALATGAAVGEVFGQFVNSAMLAMYDGEDTQNFAFLLDGEPIFGQFGGAEMLVPGELISAVISKHEGVNYAHAILSKERGLLWVQQACGVHAEYITNLKIGLYCVAFSTICFATLDYFRGPLWETHSETVLVGAISSLLISALVSIWAAFDMRSFSIPATEAFSRFGFAMPSRINLSNFSYYQRRQDCVIRKSLAIYQHKDVYCYQEAINEGRLSFDPKPRAEQEAPKNT